MTAPSRQDINMPTSLSLFLVPIRPTVVILTVTPQELNLIQSSCLHAAHDVVNIWMIKRFSENNSAVYGDHAVKSYHPGVKAMNSMLSSKSINVLLIEDSREDAVLIEKALSQTSVIACSVVKAVTINSALGIIAESEFDIVLLDISLPDTSGMEGLEAIHTLAPKLPVIVLTEYADEELVLAAIEKGAQDYMLKDQVNVQAIKRSIQFAIQRKRFEQMLVMQANVDILTGLSNRTLFEIHLENAILKSKRSNDMLGILFIDLNRFKSVNDNYGHSFGDKLLQESARRMKISIRPYDGLSRFGGDEFALLVDDIKDPRDCAKIAQKIINQLAKPFLIGGHMFEIGVSIGIITCLPEENLSREKLMTRVDEAMYRVKKTGKSDYRFYEPASDSRQELLANA